MEALHENRIYNDDPIEWHLQHHHQTTLARATINRILLRSGQVTPDPSKRPKSSYIRFEAEQPNETWQSDFTHYRLTHPDGRPGTDVEIISWLDDHSRYALHASAHTRITTPIVLATFRKTAGQHGIPASTLTDNGMVYTVRLAGTGRQGGRNGFEQQLVVRTKRVFSPRADQATSIAFTRRSANGIGFVPSPSGWMDERSGGPTEPLGDPHDEVHVSEPGSAKVRQPRGRAVELLREARPGKVPGPPLLVEGFMQLAQVPPEPAVCACVRQLYVAHIVNRADQEVLRWPAEPPQHEERVLARRRAALVQSLDRSAAQRVISATLRVQLGGQLPQFVGELVPAESEVTALLVKRVEERAAIEDRQWPHASQPMSGDTAPSLSFDSPLTCRNRPTNGCDVPPKRAHGVETGATLSRGSDRRPSGPAFAPSACAVCVGRAIGPSGTHEQDKSPEPHHRASVDRTRRLWRRFTTDGLCPRAWARASPACVLSAMTCGSCQRADTASICRVSRRCHFLCARGSRPRGSATAVAAGRAPCSRSIRTWSRAPVPLYDVLHLGRSRCRPGRG
jgi:hypothetical protein